jgi:hypothetical protein
MVCDEKIDNILSQQIKKSKDFMVCDEKIDNILPQKKSKILNKMNTTNTTNTTNNTDSMDNNNKSDKKIKYVNTTSDEIKVVLEVKSTDNPDVYKLNCVEKQIVDKKTMLKKVSMGIAHIKGINASHMMRKVFENKKSVLMNCRFNDENSKFEPIDINTSSKFPTLLEEIESKLAIMEESESEEN